MIANLILLFLVVGQILFVKKILKFVIYSPVYLYILFSLSSIIVSVLYYYYYPIDLKFSFFNLDYVNSAKFNNIIYYYLWGLNSFIFGVLLYHYASKTKTRKLYQIKFSSTIPINIGSVETIKTIVSNLFGIVLFLFVLGYGSALFYRLDYIPEDQIRLVIMLIKVLSLVLILFLGVLHGKDRKLANTYFFVLMLLILGVGSRIGFLYLMMYILVTYNGKNKNFKTNSKFVIQVVCALFFFAYLIQLRTLSVHGLIPYLGYVFSSYDEIFRYFLFNLYYVLIFGVFVSIETVKDAVVDWDTIFISLNPLPGSMVGWYEIFDKLRVNIYAPYTSNGEVFSMGIWFSVFFYTCIGILFGYFETHFRKLLNSNRKILAFILLILLVLHIIYGFEYNLRSTVRYIYYALAFIAIVKMFTGVKFKLNTSEKK